MKPRRKNAKDQGRQKETLTLANALFQRELHVELTGNAEALVDGCKGIVEYNENTIRLNIPEGQIKFSGRGLQIACMNEESMIIRGYIMGLEYCY